MRFSVGCASACCVPDASAGVAGLVRFPPRADFRSAQDYQAPLLRFLAPSAFTGPCCAVRGPPALRTIPLRLSPALNGAPMRFFALGRDKPLRIEGWPVLSGGLKVWLSDRRSRRVIQHRFLVRRRTGPIPWSFRTAWSGVYPTTLVGFCPSQFFSGPGVFGPSVRFIPHAVSFVAQLEAFCSFSRTDWGVRVRLFPTDQRHETRLPGFPSTQPHHADSSTWPLLPWAFSSSRFVASVP